MVLSKTIGDLEYDVLLHIFSFFSAEEIINTIQQVCVQWKEVSQDPWLWSNLVYCPKQEDSNIQIDNFLLQATELRAVDFSYVLIGFSTEEALLKVASNLRKLVLRHDQRFRHKYLAKLLTLTTELEYLALPGKHRYTADISEAIGTISHLKVLKVMPFSSIKSILPLTLEPIIKGCPLLEHIDFEHYHCEFDDLKSLLCAKREHLHTLMMKCSSIERKCTLPLLSSDLTLKCLHVSNFCQDHDEKDFLRIKEFKNLEELKLQGSHIPKQTINLIFTNSNLYSLKTLHISCYEGPINGLCATIFENCKYLQSLTLSYCTLMTNDCFNSLFCLKELRYLYIHCEKLQDGIMDLLVPCCNLKELHLYGCNRLTAVSWARLVEFPKLEVLKLIGCKLKGVPYELFPNKLKRLKLLGVYCSLEKNRAALRKLKQEMPHITLQGDKT